MKSRILFILLLVVTLFILLTRSNHTVQDAILNVVTPIKQIYKNLTQSVKDRGKSYIFQKETIQKLTKENKILRKYLLDQTRYLGQVSGLYKALPSLAKLPRHSTELVDTISYVRLNSFNEVQLARSGKATLKPDHLYGLIQNDVVGGTAVLRGKHLYGYLTSNPRCRFGVFIGPKRSPGIAEGLDKNTMVVKFIPKWSKINVGDKVETSGLDGIFFANVPVGVVKEVKIEDSYKSAYITTYSDTLHSDYFFLITDPTPYLISTYDKNTSFPESSNSTVAAASASRQQEKISSIPETIQTQDNEVDPSAFEIPKETPPPKPPVVFRHPSIKKPVPRPKTKPKQTSKPPAKKPQTSVPVPPTPIVPTSPTPKPAPKHKSAMDILNGR